MNEKLRLLLAESPNAVSGSGGHKTTFAVACMCWRHCENFDTVHEAMTWYNQNRCNPTWTEKEILHKVLSAQKIVGSEVGMYAPKHFTPTRCPAFVKKSVPKSSATPSQVSQDWLELPLWLRNELFLITREKAPQKPSCAVLERVTPTNAIQAQQLTQIIKSLCATPQDWGKLPEPLQEYILAYTEYPVVPSVALLVSVPLPPEPMRQLWAYAIAACAIRDALGGVASDWWDWARGQQLAPALPKGWNVQLPDLRRPPQLPPVQTMVQTAVQKIGQATTLFELPPDEKRACLCVKSSSH